MNAVVDIDQVEETARQMCDDFCYFRVAVRNQEILDLYCEECPMANLLRECREHPIGKNDWQE